MFRTAIVLIATAICGTFLFSNSAAALRADVQAAVDALEKLGNDNAKVKEYCTHQDAIDAAGEDEAQLDAAFDQLDSWYESLGDEYAAILDVGEEPAEGSEDLQALDAAYDNLDSKCGE